MQLSRVATAQFEQDGKIVSRISTQKGRTVVSPYTDAEAFIQLDRLTTTELARSKFANELAAKGHPHPVRVEFRGEPRYTGDIGGLSAEQIKWIHILVVDAEAKLAGKVDPRQIALPGLSFEPVVKLLKTAAERGLKRPRLTFEKVTLTLAGRAARIPGSVNVVSNGRFETRTWFGRIMPNGTIEKGRDWTPEVEAFLRDLAENPAGVAAAHGHQTGNCCFCRRELTDARSVTVGYGPICAEKFNLPWGHTTEAVA